MGKLSGLRIIITSGPTRGPIDAVRYIANKSTGRLGSLIAQEALAEGAEVTFIYGKESLLPPAQGGLRLVEVETVPDLVEAVEREMGQTNYDAIIHAMAVLDYVPEAYVPEKTPSEQEEWWVKLVKTPKVIKRMRELNPEAFLVGFKLEVGRGEEELIRIAHRSLLNNRADLVVANDLVQIEKGNHVAYLVDPQGEAIKVVGKEEIAKRLVEVISQRLGRGGRKGG